LRRGAHRAQAPVLACFPAVTSGSLRPN